MSRQIDIRKITGRRIAQKREEAGLTQDEMSLRMGMSEEGYARYERGLAAFTVSKLAKIAAIFECGLDELVVESSTGLSAQAKRIANLLDGLSTSDRDEVVSIVEKVCGMARKKYKSGSGHKP